MVYLGECRANPLAVPGGIGYNEAVARHSGPGKIPAYRERVRELLDWQAWTRLGGSPAPQRCGKARVAEIRCPPSLYELLWHMGRGGGNKTEKDGAQMEPSTMGQLIACRRRELGMTQRQLAAKLNITDKAVSKWERGLSCPDVTLLAGLAQALGISTGELLDPRQNSDGTDTQREKAVEQTLAYAAHSVRRVSRRVRLISFASLSAAFFIGILTCAICDWCIEGAFTWSWYPVSSILFAWAVLAPAVLMERGGVGTSLGVLTLLILPYLYVLSLLVGDSRLMMALSIPCAAIGMGYLWAIYLLFRFLPDKRCLSGAISLVLAVPVSFLINLVMANLLGDALWNVWDLLGGSLALAGAGVLFWLHLRRSSRPE